MYSNLFVSLNSPIVFEIKDNGAKYIKFFVFDSKQNLIATLEKQAKDGKANFDVAYILQNSIKENTQKLVCRAMPQGRIVETNNFEDDRNCVKFKVAWQLDNYPITYHNKVFFAINSKIFNQKQTYQTTDEGNNVYAEILTTGTITKYEGYPLTITCKSQLGNNLTTYRTQRGILGIEGSLFDSVSYLATSKGRITSFGNNIIMRGRNELSTYQGVFNAEIDAQDGTFFELANTQNGKQTTTIIQKNCTIKNPYYIKWINLNGGWQYFMFSFNQSIETKKDGQEILKGYAPQTYQTKRTAIGTEYERILTIGAENLSKEEFNNLYSLLYSDFVFHYDEQTKAWTRIFINNQSLTHYTNGRSFNVEFSVLL